MMKQINRQTHRLAILRTWLLATMMLASALSAFAQKQDGSPLSLEDYAVQVKDGGHYYVTLAGTGQFLRGGNAWGTQATLAPLEIAYEVVLYGDYTPQHWPEEHGWAFSFPAIPIGDDTYIGDLMFKDTEHVFLDAYNGSRNTNIAYNRDHTAWTLSLNKDGISYHLSNIAADGCFGWDGETMGEASPLSEGRDSVPGPLLTFIDIEAGTSANAKIDWAFIPVAVVDAYWAKATLYKVLEFVKYKEVQTADIIEVYNKQDVTAEELKAAMTLLIGRIMKMKCREADATAYIKNPDCEDTEGWSGFYTQTNHYEGIDGAAINEHFFEVWRGGEAVGDATLIQTITIPVGRYRLQADAIASWQSDEAVEVEGVTLYAESEFGRVNSKPIYTKNGQPQPISIEFFGGGATKIGVQINGTNANWVAVDNFKLVEQNIMKLENTVDIMAYQWDFLCQPFDVEYNDIKHEDNNTQFVIHRYDGAGRAAHGIGDNWKLVQAGETLAAGEGFILQHNAASGSESFVFPASDNLGTIFTSGDVTVPLQEHPSEWACNEGWNLIGNPYSTYYNMEWSDFNGAVTVWNGEGYDAYRPHDDKVILHPFEAFFVQRQDKEAITFKAQAPSPVPPRGEAVTNDSGKRRATEQRSSLPLSESRTLINLTVHALPHGEGRGGGSVGRSASTRIVLNDLASRDYELSCDAAKFFGTGLDLYTIEGGTAYAINERPLDDGIVSVGISCAEAGTYTITTDHPLYFERQMDHEAEDRERSGNGASEATTSYTFYAEAGKTLLKVRLDGVTGIDTTRATTDDATYTLSGVRIDNCKAVTSHRRESSGNPQRRGIYIRAGRKYVR